VTTIKVLEDEVLNFREVFQALRQGQKKFLIDEGPDLSKIMMGDLPLVEMLKDHGDIEVTTYNLVQDDVAGVSVLKDSDPALVPFLHYAQHKLTHIKTPRSIEKHFGLFVAGSRWHRLMLASYLFDKHASKSIIGYRQSITKKDQPCNLRLDELFLRTYRYNDHVLPSVTNFLHQLPLEVTDEANDNRGFINYDQTWQLAGTYDKIFLDVVCETWHNGNCFSPTEKTARAIVCRTPFLVYAGKGFLANLRKWGFMTFDEIWDESYDVCDGVDRIVKMQSVLEKLSNKSLAELGSLYAKIQPILEHNVKIYNGLPDQNNLVELLDN